MGSEVVSVERRRAAIMKLLILKRRSTLCEIAQEFSVSDRTIYSDLVALTTEYPIETVRGNGGGVRLCLKRRHVCSSH